MAVSKDVLAVADDTQGLSLLHINAKDTAQRRRFNVNRSLQVTVQVVLATRTGAGSPSSWRVKVSNDGVNFNDFPTGSIFVAPGNITDILDVSGYMFLEVSCTSASSFTTETVNLIVCRQS